ncbi:MAG: hypothetical protein QM802_14185 [Agriterribacter sp.]
MHSDFSHLSEEERLKAENEFLKMKLMLEHDAKFPDDDSNLPAVSTAMENEFLNYIMAFEEQSKNPTYVKVFDRIERPNHFKPAAQIADSEINTEWEKLQDYLYKYRITLDVCSPNISVRELYRFTTEELFEHEMSDMHVAGMMTTFIYDEFHPDDVYDNSRLAAYDCIKLILKKDPLEWDLHFRKEDLRLNNHFPLTMEEFKQITSHYKDTYNELNVVKAEYTKCQIKEDNCIVTGTYTIDAITNRQSITLSGNWTVQLELDKQIGYWYFYDVEIEGIKF